MKLRELRSKNYKSLFFNRAGDQPLLEAVDLGVKYTLDEKTDSLWNFYKNKFSALKNNGSKEFWALKNINFKGYSGDVIGVIGSNGAGKTTLCRAIFGLLKPDQGCLKFNGNVSALLSLGTGFNNELSGRENIILNGMMLGFSKKEMKTLMPKIHEFSGVGHFIEEPVRIYSRGMRARLGFSVAAHLKAEILVIDEVLNAGDLEFRERAAEKIQELVENAGLVIVVSHSMDFVKKTCNRALWIEKGELMAFDDPDQVVPLYKEKAAGKVKGNRKLNLKINSVKAGSSKVIAVEDLGVKFKRGRKIFWALKDINFSVYEKEIISIIGHNGAGKTTLCRVLSGLYKNDQGSLYVDGEVQALFGFNAGFNMMLSGRENIYLNGMFLGIPKTELKQIEQEIIEFSGLKDFIDVNLINYSLGMKLRLGFSVAAMLKPDIFIVDEALSAGDLEFKEKATLKMQELLEKAKTVIIVTHSMDIVERVSTRALVLQKGQIIYDGSPEEAVRSYRKSLQMNNLT